MPYDNERLNDIYDKTDGRCHLCSGGLTFRAYGDVAHPRGWEVEHSIPRALGGTDRLNNLYAAHIDCNRSKGTISTRSILTRAPMSLTEQNSVRAQRAITFAGLGALIGGGLAGKQNEFAQPHERVDPRGPALALALFGAFIGYAMDPE